MRLLFPKVEAETDFSRDKREIISVPIPSSTSEGRSQKIINTYQAFYIFDIKIGKNKDNKNSTESHYSIISA